MKLALGVNFQNNSHWLALHLPAMLSAGGIRNAAIDGVVAIDGGTTDNSMTVVRQVCAQYDVPLDLTEVPFTWDFGTQQNNVVRRAEELGYTHLLKWDPDELMFPEAIQQVRLLFGAGYVALWLPRINFEKSRFEYCPELYPDWQGRAWELNRGISWEGVRHATIGASLSALGLTSITLFGKPVVIKVPDCPIFHYEGLNDGYYRRLKQLNYEETARGNPPLSYLPPEAEPVPYRHRIPFVGHQPYVEGGPLAPFEEEIDGS